MGRGIFCRVDSIPAGTVILQEDALLFDLPQEFDSNWRQIREIACECDVPHAAVEHGVAFARASQGLQDVVLKMANTLRASASLAESIRRATDRLLEVDIIPSGSDTGARACILVVMHTAFDVPGGATALLPSCALLNHSCLPNCDWSVEDRGLTGTAVVDPASSTAREAEASMVVRTVREVQRGEELNIR
jgi:hypothetical protein